MTTNPLTARALALGAVVGAGLGVANLVFSLKTGLSVGVALTAVTLAGALRRTARVPFSMAEGTMTQSLASAAGYSTGSTLASSAAAWVLLEGRPPPAAVLAVWTVLISLYGCLLAWPLRATFIEREPLPFPSGTAAAVALRSLWEQGERAVRQARALFGSLAAAGAVTLLRDGLRLVPATWAPVASISPWGFGLDLSLLAVGAGALLGLRLGLTLLLGAVLGFGVFGPLWSRQGLLASADVGGVATFSMWPGVALFAGAALAHFTFAGLRMLRARKPPSAPRQAAPLPWRTHLAAAGVVAVALVVVAHAAFGLSWLTAGLAIALAAPACLVSCRVTGETDVTPGGPLGQLSQLALGPLPGAAGSNVMGGGLTAGAAASAADLMTDLKTGALLDVEPRRQLTAQLLGCAVGGALIAPLFVVLVPSAAKLGTGGFPVPAAQVFASTARVLVEGASALPAGAATVSLVALALGVALALLEASSTWARTWLPSPTALGLALLLPPSLSLAFAAGAVFAFVWARRKKAAAEAYAAPIAAGLIAGESLAGAGVAIRAALE
ncbi:MAG: OPT/YSL family transporter [Myxococcaceae bacterium]|nr:OPT/YSL family transporter [Myxococcaceae bacterium]